jgi:drug/metabolite transporter (DMT)-like permease
MSKADFAALIALCAALASAVGDVIRQRSAQEITDKPVGHLELFRLSLRDTRWWLGGGGAVANYSLQAAALALGSVMLVTALQVTSLLFALPIYARLALHRVTRWEWMWAILLAAALAVVVAVGDPDAGHARGSLQTWIPVAVVLGPVMVLCVLGARVWSDGPGRAGATGRRGWLIVGAVRRADQGRRRGGGRRIRGAAAGARVLCLDTGRAGRHDFSAVVVSRRRANRLHADRDGGEACGGLAARHACAR